jgi:hypothetical protein
MSHRIQLTLTDEQHARLVAESRRSGLSHAELIRRAIDGAHSPTRPEQVLRALDESFGSWTERDFDGASYVDQLRSEIARRRAR